MTAFRERHVSFACGAETCLGVLAEPAVRAPGPGVVVVVGGPQYRAGSHRQFVHLARHLAQAGVPVLRFDCRGMGDSGGERRTFEAIDDDLRAAIDALCRESGVDAVVPWGLCDGASAALMYAPSDARVHGVVAVNPWARTEDVAADTRLRHYYLQRLASREFWAKLLSGRFRARASAQGLAATLRAAGRGAGDGFLERMDAGWARFPGRVLFVLSGRDHTAREFETWVGRDAARARRLQSPASSVERLDGADHTFSSRADAVRVADLTLAWLRASWPA